MILAPSVEIKSKGNMHRSTGIAALDKIFEQCGSPPGKCDFLAVCCMRISRNNKAMLCRSDSFTRNHCLTQKHPLYDALNSGAFTFRQKRHRKFGDSETTMFVA